MVKHYSAQNNDYQGFCGASQNMNQALDAAPSEPRREAFLVALGERVRRLRAIRGMTRKSLSQVTGVSERHLANLEHGVGNASILVLLQIARAFNCALAELVGDVTTESPDWLLIRELLSGRTESDLQRAREALTQLFGVGAGAQRPNRTQRVALIGLRGAGKSTLGQMLADDLGYPFVELNREIRARGRLQHPGDPQPVRPQRLPPLRTARAGRGGADLPEMVLATPGGLVSEPATLNLLLAHCYTVWLRATPEEHMGRVMAQGDFRPMSGNNEAMADLKRILAGREAFYAKADLTWVTSNLDVKESFAGLRTQVRKACGLPL